MFGISTRDDSTWYYRGYGIKTILLKCQNKIFTRVLLRKKKKSFCTAKPSIPMSINDFAEMTILDCLIYFFIKTYTF